MILELFFKPSESCVVALKLSATNFVRGCFSSSCAVVSLKMSFSILVRHFTNSFFSSVLSSPLRVLIKASACSFNRVSFSKYLPRNASYDMPPRSSLYNSRSNALYSAEIFCGTWAYTPLPPHESKTNKLKIKIISFIFLLF